MPNNKTMRAIVIDDYGSPLRLAELPIPEPAPGEVLVRVQDASINGFDLAAAAGYARGYLEYSFPAVLGKDFAGVVESLGDGVSGFSVADQVFGVVTKMQIRDGSFGEYVAVPTAVGITQRPAGLDLEVAGALGLAGTAAIQAVDSVQAHPGDLVLVTGATGGVGAVAIQLLVGGGAVVIATARPGAEEELVRGLGASHVVDYSQDLAEAVRGVAPDGVDAALHLAGDGSQVASLVRSGGRMTSTLGFRPDSADEAPLASTAVMANPDSSTLDRLAGLVLAGSLRIPITARYSLPEVPKGFEDFARGTRGKLAVTVA